MKNQVIVTSGVGQAIELSGFALCDKGGVVLLARPHYGNFPIDLGYRVKGKIVGVSFGDVDPFSVESVVAYEKALEEAEQQGIRVRNQEEYGEDPEKALRILEARLQEVLLKYKIFLALGADFGSDIPGWIRIVFAHEKPYLTLGLERMVKAIEAFHGQLEEDKMQTI
ncbi:1-aminocyclopropane-1-carboxylate synthase 1 [Fusarium mexicanum]|uniref:1-aminocyclopropane-1-carboxylate synthase 1 n=1 Tax=Fusarium mexicanum TaxID=751941 RepID=A0A8H5INE4_9HYPO|nr:1-aminocyclopropane-1-carboxylate synthase 1 [Fusarium mexicanum]